MTNYNERLDEIIADVKAYSLVVAAENSVTGFDVYTNPESGLVRAKAAITSLIKELVAEAKPKLPALFTELNDISVIMYKKGTDEFEQNLLEALEEV